MTLIADADGNNLLGNPLEERTYFTTQSGEYLEDERFVPVEYREDTIFGEGLDQNLYGEVDANGVRQATYNNRPLHRFDGAADEDYNMLARERGFYSIDDRGELFDFGD